jgi:flavorubredoxin
MKALVVYDTRFGNTRQIAQIVGDALEERFDVQIVPAAEAAPLPTDIDLLVIGGPTHAHGASADMKALLNRVRRRAAFDTRFRMPRWLSGSAAGVIAKRLKQAGCAMTLPPESFFVARTQGGRLLPGEDERARAWARAVLEAHPASARAQPTAGPRA